MGRRMRAAARLVGGMASLAMAASCSDAPTAPSASTPAASSSTTITMTSPPPSTSSGSGSRILIQPELVTLAPGETQQLTVTLCRDEGCRDCTASAHWDTIGAGYATVQKGGLVTGHETGDTTFRASCEGPFNYVTTKVRIPMGMGSPSSSAAGIASFVSPTRTARSP
jgi:Bacterial Ig-like domain (group 2)